MNEWKIANVEELTEEQQKEYLDKVKKEYDERKHSRKNVWRTLFAAGALGIMSGALLIGIGGEAFNTPGAITIISSTLAEFGIAFGALSNISDIEMAAKKEIEEIKRKIGMKR